MEWQRQRRSGGATLCACILEPFLVYFLGVLGVLTIPDRELTGIGSTRPDPQSINQQHTLLILGTFVEERQWRGGLIVEHFPQMSSHHNYLPHSDGKIDTFFQCFLTVSPNHHLETDKCGVCSTHELLCKIVTFYAEPPDTFLRCSWNRVCVVLLE